jgi:hypothetical protein
MTFAELDRQAGDPPLEPAKEEEYPLPAWYRSIYHKPLAEFSSSDISRACRQKIHLQQIVPMAIQLLDQDVAAGDIYPGEMLAALGLVPASFWPDNQQLKNELLEIVRREANAITLADMSDIAKELLIRLNS